MDNLTHTLLGLAFAKSGLERSTPLATTALVISSNLPDIDNVALLRGGVLSALQYHRGFTHGFFGLAILAGALTLALTFLDRRFRLRRDPFRRPLRPVRIFWLAYLGGLAHAFMDFTNSYGVRPLEPFSHRWFYGDLAFIVDPWIWLILGSAAVWLTATGVMRAFFWLAAGTAASLIVGLALRSPSEFHWVISPVAREIWFVGALIVVIGAIRGWGRAPRRPFDSASRMDPSRLARYALFALVLYYGLMWLAHQSALNRASASLPSGATSVAAWPTPADPRVWQLAVTTEASSFLADVNLQGGQDQWREVRKLDPKLLAALRESPEARSVMDFMRYSSGSVEESGSGYTVTVRDLRFSLRMRAELSHDLEVESVDVRWF